MGRIPFPPAQKPKSMRTTTTPPPPNPPKNTTAVAHQLEGTKLPLSALPVGTEFELLYGRKGKVLEHINTQACKVWLEEHNLLSACEVIKNSELEVYTMPDPMPAPEPAESELVSTTRIYLQDVPVGARCKIMHGNTPVEVKVKKVTPPTETVNYVTVEIEIDGKLWTRAGMTEVLGIYGKEDTAIAVDNAAKAKEAGRAKAAVKTLKSAEVELRDIPEGSSFMGSKGEAVKVLKHLLNGTMITVPPSTVVYKWPSNTIVTVGLYGSEPITAPTTTSQYEQELAEKYADCMVPSKPTAAITHDPVNSPSHYTDGKIETIDFIEAIGLGFHLGNAVKYLSRAGKKGDLVEDLKKARWYVDRAMNRDIVSRDIRRGEARDDIAGYLERYVMTKQLSVMQYDSLGCIVDGALDDAVATITRHIDYIESGKI